MTERRLRDDALAIWSAGVAAVEAGRLTSEAMRIDDGRFLEVRGSGALGSIPLPAARRVGVVGAGKATTTMARAAERVLDDRISAGWVNVPDATVEPLLRIHVHGARKLPDNRPTAEGAEGSRRIVEIARSLREGDLLLCLISGGGSALLPLPVEAVPLADKLAVTKLLQASGATINEMNCVRKHLSQIKGGRLAHATKARVITLIVSDVIGDPLDVIASGPTAPDPTTFAEALAVLEGHELVGAVPPSVVAHLVAGARGLVEETPKTLGDRVTNLVIGGNHTARRVAVRAAERLGYKAIDLGVVEGETQSAVCRAVEDVLQVRAEPRITRRVCLVYGGETTLTLPPNHGKGGRNQEFALAILDALGPDGLAGVCVLCGGTDGEDGPTDAAGAFVDEELARDAVARGLDPADFLRRHDAYNFFEPLGGLVKTGPTNTNVMDLRVVLVDRGVGAAVPALAEPSRKRASAEPQG